MSSTRRFAIVSPNFYPRVCGIGDHSARLAAELQRRGHQVNVFSRDPVARHPEAPEIDVRGVAGGLPIVIAQKIADAVAAKRPTDVILQYTSQMWDAWRFGSPALTLLAARVRDAGASVTLIAHEPFVPWRRRPDLMLAALMQRIHFAGLLRSCDHVFVTTDTRVRYIAPYCDALGVAAPGVIRVGANAVPVVRAPALTAAPTALAGPSIGVFSTAAAGKKFAVVFDAFARVARAFPSARLVLIGDLGAPDRPAVKEIMNAIRHHPFRAHIRVTGRLSLSQIAAELVVLDVCLFPMNTGANTRSGTLPAALGAGLPVVAIQGIETDVNLFRDGENIALASELSGEAFAQATLRLLRDRSLLDRIGEGARELYADHLSWRRIADQLLAAIESSHSASIDAHTTSPKRPTRRDEGSRY